MNDNTYITFDSIFDYQKANPEKFELIRDNKKRIPYLLIAGLCLLLAVFPGWLPFCPGWFVRTAALIGLGVSGFIAWSTGEYYRCVGSGEPLRQIGTKTFRNGKDPECRKQILEAFARRDFEFLANEPSAKGPALTLSVWENPGQREFYLHIMYFTDERICGATGVLEFSGADYTANEQHIRAVIGK